MPKVVIATRKSPLALIQAGIVKKALSEAHPGNEYELLEITTEGDRILDRPLAAIGGKGLFIKDIEKALLEGRADIAAHSAKDLPVEIPRELTIGAMLRREDPFDVLISRDGKRLVELPKGAKIGTSSSRRKAQLLVQRDDLEIVELRGNVNTRLGKLDSGMYDAIVLAHASVGRMGLAGRIAQHFDDRYLIPSAGQGAIALETRRGDKFAAGLVSAVNDKKTFSEVEAERIFLSRIGGGCQLPVAVYCVRLSDDRYHLKAAIYGRDGKDHVICERVGFKNVIVAFELANEILEIGGRRILDSLNGKRPI